MGRLDGDDMAAHRACEAQIADDVQDFVAYQFVRIAKGIKPLLIVVDDNILQRSSKTKAHLAKGVNFFFVSDGARWRDFPAIRRFIDDDVRILNPY